MNTINKSILHISDYHYISPIKNAVLLCGEPEKIVEEIEKNYPNASLFVININYKTENICRSQSKGIKVLKLLRLKNYNQHCILYSFFPREYFIEKDCRNLIIYSPGVSFIKLPKNFRDWNINTFLDKGEAPKDLAVYFRAESRLPDNRHFFANWWGVWQLWQVQKAVENIAGIEKADHIARNFGNAYKEISSYQGLLARYLYGHRYDDITKKLKEKENKRKEYID
ncbi:MAG: hypothetical protein Q4B43_10255, partial [Bacteroidota bacterium]|nr:hypothetical protein [Bacteroidota bacterium]